jgi:hypothetical protein
MAKQAREENDIEKPKERCKNIYLTGNKKGQKKKTVKPCNCDICLPARVGTTEFPKYSWYNCYMLFLNGDKEQVYFRQSNAVHSVEEITGDLITKREWLDSRMSTRYTVSEGLVYDNMSPTDIGLNIFGTTALLVSLGKTDNVIIGV